MRKMGKRLAIIVGTTVAGMAPVLAHADGFDVSSITTELGIISTAVLAALAAGALIRVGFMGYRFFTKTSSHV